MLFENLQHFFGNNRKNPAMLVLNLCLKGCFVNNICDALACEVSFRKISAKIMLFPENFDFWPNFN